MPTGLASTSLWRGSTNTGGRCPAPNGPAFLTPDGTLTTEVMADGLHPTTKGYAMWAAAINDKVRELMR